MKWLPRWSRQSSSVVRPEPEKSVEDYPSLALNVLVHQLKPERKYSILDLGPAFGANVDFFSRYSCRIHIENLYETLNSFDCLSPEDGFTYRQVFEYLLPFPRGTRFDVVLAWDLPNYLNREEIRWLFEHVVKFCHPGALLLTMISTRRHIPEQPYRFKIIDEQTLRYEGYPSVLRPGPSYSDRDLEHLLRGFRVHNSFLLRNGFREYLFVFKGRAAPL